MKFTYNGLNYRIEFERKVRTHKVLLKDEDGHPVRDENDGVIFEDLPDDYPSTTVRIIQEYPDLPSVIPGAQIVLRTNTVKPWRNEPFTLEHGRIYALRSVTPGWPRKFKQAMWEAYINRGK